MRPVSLHLSGFTAFRHPTDLDFTDADLFALTGPTGAGKSSIIDAICFALYGSIPRLGGVAPIVSLGKQEARVRLVFEVEGTTYTVSRLVSRQGDGASQKDVRLEGPDFAVAGVREVDSRIESLLGLGFDHFTRCVVLPQGRFAAFLEDGAAARERLLKQLLDLGVYEEMRKRAASHAARLEGEIQAMDAQLHDLLVEPVHVDEAAARLEELQVLRVRVEESWSELEETTISLSEAQATRESVAADRGRIDAIRPPSDLGSITERLGEARAAAEQAASAVADAEAHLEKLAGERSELGELAALDRALDAHRTLAALGERMAKSREAVADAAGKEEAATRRMAEASEAVERAGAAQRELERRHAAHAIRGGLGPGDECPVCLQTVAVVPDETSPADLDAGAAAMAAAVEDRDRATGAAAAAATDLARQRALLEQLEAEVEVAARACASLPPPESITADRARAAVLDSDLADARVALASGRGESERAAARLAAAEVAGEAASRALDMARDTLAGLEPPMPARRDPAEDWKELAAWCHSRGDVLAARLVELDSEVRRLEEKRTGIARSLAEQAAKVGIDAEAATDLRVQVAERIAREESMLARLRTDLDKKERLTVRRASTVGEARRYDEVATLLRSNRFQQWLIEEALVGLVEFANVELAKLAGGAYSLAVDGGEFEVVDHRNAEARRSVKTLSGGETFLVSLALALALAERVVATSAIGTARIESMFLDEGFGTLDAETLDTVASVVQELGSRDRMIGLVTHVRELAEQIPIRFEVRRQPHTSTVSRVEG